MKVFFIKSKHVDKAHIHNHIIWNSTALDCKRKFRDFFRSARALRRLSDLICVENGLSVIENPKQKQGKDYGKWLGNNRQPSFQDRLRSAVDAALEQNPSTFEEFLALMKTAGYEINQRRKHITFKLPEQKSTTRLDTLRGNYTEAAIRERIEGRRLGGSSAPLRRTELFVKTRRPNLLIDIEAKLREGKGAGYAHWAKVNNLKQMAQTLIFLQEKGLDDYSVLETRAKAATARFNELSERLKELETDMNANATLQKHIITYAKTKQTYIDYRKAGYSKKFKELHETDILLHQAAKKAFDELGVKKLPTVASLRAKYAPLLDEKKTMYSEYKQVKAEMRELLTAKSNVDRLFNNAGQTSERINNERVNNKNHEIK